MKHEYTEQFQNENDSKMAGFKRAVDKGELDRLHVDQTISGKYGRRFERLVMDLTSEKPENFEDVQFIDFMKLIYSLLQNGDQPKVEHLIRKHLSDYKIESKK